MKIEKKHIVGCKKQIHESLKATLDYWTQKSAQPNYGKSTVCWKIDSQIGESSLVSLLHGWQTISGQEVPFFKNNAWALSSKTLTR